MRNTLTLLFLLSLSALATAQVGVNNTNPQQALDVNGKVRLTDDDTTPTDGTIRYDDSSESFEGFTGGGWQSFNKQATPEDVEEITTYAFNLTPAIGGDQTVNWSANVETIAARSGTSLFDDEVPAGKYYVIDHIQVTARDRQPDEFFYVGIARAVVSNGDVSFLRNPRIYLSGNSSTGTQELVAARAPLLILRAGEQLALYNSDTSETSIRVVVHGFYVDQDRMDEFYTY